MYMHFLSNSHDSNICLLQLIMGIVRYLQPFGLFVLCFSSEKCLRPLCIPLCLGASKLTSVIIIITTELNFRTFCSCCGKHQEARFRNQWLCLGRNGGLAGLSLEYNFISEHPCTWKLSANGVKTDWKGGSKMMYQVRKGDPSG